MGAMFVNCDGEVFMHPLETRDVAASGIIRECKERGKGVQTPQAEGIWLDTPMIDMIHGEGTLEKRLPGMLRMYLRCGIDMRKVPIVIYPTLHYQNGGIKITANGMSDIENLYVAGEAVGGIHGRNRLMGNSLLDIIVFGRNAGKEAGAKCKNVKLADLTLSHVEDYSKMLADAGIEPKVVSPKLLPDYRPEGVTRLDK
jgi:succinate dehydrogenase / fumarate reductase flavoprotein subunit